MLWILVDSQNLAICVFTGVKVSVKENLGVSLKFLVSATLESMGYKVYFSEKKFWQINLKQLKSLCFVSRHNLRAKNVLTYHVNHTWQDRVSIDSDLLL